MKNKFKYGDIVYVKDDGDDYWEKAEFLKYDEELEYGKYVCLVFTHDGKIAVCCDDAISEEEYLALN